MPVRPNQHVRKLKTVKVQADNELGYAVINEVDFDKKKHKLYKQSKRVKPKDE